MIGKVLKKHGGFYVVSADNQHYECKLSGKQKYRQRDYIVAGDYVCFEPEKDASTYRGYILSVEPRKNFIPRPGIANVDQILIVAAIKTPSYDFLLLDKLIAIARYFGIEPTLCFSKMDLATSQDRTHVETYYQHAKVPLMFISATSTLTPISKYCYHKTTVITGNSGVGKSSLINRLLGEEVQSIQDISLKLNRGKNTTRTAAFFPYEGGFIVDTPGFSALDFPFEVKKERLKDLYLEYAAHSADCRFNNCVHLNEPDCEVKTLVGSQYFSPERHENYKKLYMELETREKLRK